MSGGELAPVAEQATPTAAPPDQALAGLTRALVASLAPALGLIPGDVRVRLGPEGRRARAHGARGLMADGQVYLDPAAFDPRRPEGQGLLAHELVHLAQRRAPLAGERPEPGAAEAEAAAIAAAVAGGRGPWRPAALLARDAWAADNGTATATRPDVPNPAQAARRQDGPPAPPPAVRPSTDGEAQRGEVVALQYQAQIRELHDLMGYPPDRRGLAAVTALEILDVAGFAVARAIVRALDRRLLLARALDSEHHRAHPRSGVAVLAGLTVREVPQLEAANVEGVETALLDETGRLAFDEVLRGARSEVLVSLLKGPKRDAFRAIMTGPRPAGRLPAPFAAALRAAGLDVEDGQPDDEKSRKELADAVAEVDRLVAKGGAGPAIIALDRLAQLANVPAAAKPLTGKVDGRPVLEPPKITARFRRAITQLEQKGRIVTLLDDLPGSVRTVHSPWSQPLLAVLSARAPEHNLALARQQISYNFLDWVVFDREAEWAYILVRACPLDAQDRFVALDDGKWIRRLEDNLNEDLVREGYYRGIGSAPSRLDKLLQSDPKTGRKAALDAAQLVDEIVREIKAAGFSGIDHRTARRLLDKLIAFGRDIANVQMRIAARSVAVQRLDALGHFMDIVRKTSSFYLQTEGVRAGVLELFVACDPWRLWVKLPGLLSLGLLDWAVTAEEAWLAGQLIRALPVPERERFFLLHPELAANIRAEQTAEMRASRSYTSFDERAFPNTRTAVLDRLADKTLWTAARSLELRSMILIARELDLGRAVFDQSQRFAAYSIPGLGPLADSLGLYHPKARPFYKRERLFSAWAEGPVQALGDWTKYVIVGFRALFLDDSIDIGHSLELKEFPLSQAQWALGNDLMGAQLAEHGEDRERLNRAPKAPGKDSAANSLWLRFDSTKGNLWMRLPRLELKSANFVRPGMSIRTGPVSLKGLEINASFADRGYETPIGANMKVDELDARDVAVTSPKLPDGISAATRAAVKPFTFDTGSLGTRDAAESKPRRGGIPIPVLGPIFDILGHLLAIQGTLPGSPSVVDLMLYPAGIPFPYSTAVGLVANEILPSPKPFDSVLGLITDGELRPPRTVAERLVDAIAMLRQFHVSFDSLDIEGLALGTGQSIGAVRMRDVVLGAGLSRPAYLREAKRRFERKANNPALRPADKAELERKLAAIDRELKTLEPLEKELERLERKERWRPGSLEPPERAKIRELTDKVRRSTAVVADIGSITVEGIRGVVETGDIEVGPISLDAVLPVAANQLVGVPGGEYLAAQDLVARFKAGGPTALSGPEIVRRAAQDAAAHPDWLPTLDFQLQVGKATVKARPGEPAIRWRRPVPSPADLRARLADLPPVPDFDAERKRLGDLLPDVERLTALQGKEPAKRTEDEQTTLVDLQRRLGAAFGLEVAEAGFAGLGGRLDPKTGELVVGVTGLDLRGIRYDGYSVRRISGDAGARLSGLSGPAAGLADLFAPTGVDVTRLTIEDVTGPGMQVRAAELAGFRTRVDMRPDGVRFPDLTLGSLTVSGIHLAQPDASIDAEGVTVSGLEADIDVQWKVEPDGAKTLTGVSVPRLDIDRIDVSQAVYEQRKTDDGFRLTVRSGALGNIKVRNLRLAAGAKSLRLVAGTLSVGGVERLQVGVVLGALGAADAAVGEPGRGPSTPPGPAKPWQRIDVTVQGGTTPPAGKATGAPGGPTSTGTPVPTQSQTPAQKPAAPGTVDKTAAPGTAEKAEGTPVLSAEVVSDGEGSTIKLTTEALGLLGLRYVTPSGRVEIVRTRLDARVDLNPDNSISIIRVGLPGDTEVGAIDWRAGSGRVTSGGRTHLWDVSLTGSSWQPADPASKDARLRTAGHLHVGRLHIPLITADDLRYRDPPLDLRIGAPTPATPAGEAKPKRHGLELRNVNLRNFDLWVPKDSKKPVEITGGRLTVGTPGKEKDREKQGINIDVHGALAEGLEAQGALAAKFLSADFFEGGRLALRAMGVAGDLTLTDDKDDPLVRAVVEGLDTGLVTIGPDAIEIGPPGSDGLSIGSVALSKLKLGTEGGTPAGSKTPGFRWSLVSPAGGATLLDVKARIRLERWKPGEKRHHALPFKRILVPHLSIETIEATGLTLTLPSLDLDVVIPEGQKATISKVVLEGTKDDPGLGIDGSGLVLRGRFDKADISKITGRFGTLFKGEAGVTTGAGTVGYVSSSGLTLDIQDPALENIDATLDLGGDKKITVKKRRDTDATLGAKRFQWVNGEAQTTDAYLTGLEFSAVNDAVRVLVKKLELPGESRLGGEGVVIPELRIADASLDVSFAALPQSPADEEGKGTRPSVFAALESSIERMADSLDGTIAFDVFLKVHIGYGLGSPDIKIPVSLNIAKGALNTDTLQAGLQGKIQAWDEDSRAWIVSSAVARPDIYLHGDELVFQFHVTDLYTGEFSDPAPIYKEILRWKLTGGDLTRYKGSKEVRLWKLQDIKKKPPPTDEDEKEEADADIKLITDSLEIQNIRSDLSIRNDQEIELEIPEKASPTFFGDIVLGKNGLVKLAIGGGVSAAEGIARGPQRGDRPDAIRPIAFEQANIARTNLTMVSDKGAKNTLTTGTIVITGLNNTSLLMGYRDLQYLKANLATAVIKCFRWTPEGKTPKADPKGVCK